MCLVVHGLSLLDSGQVYWTTLGHPVSKLRRLRHFATHLKSQALLIEWIKRFWATSYGWRLFLVYWTQSVFRASPGEVLASSFSFNLKHLPPFYAAVLDTWRAVNGHASADLSYLFIGGPTAQVPVSNITCKSCYDLLLGANRRSPHCELTFFVRFLVRCTGLPLGSRSISCLWTARS